MTRTALLLLALALPSAAQSRPRLWRYDAPGIHACGRFTTTMKPDRDGFYRILRITGRRNGVAIRALAKTGRPIPGNAPYAIDNRVRPAAPQLTKAGFGFRLADRTWANPFFLKDNDLEYLSVPPYKPGAGPEDKVHFLATPNPSPGLTCDAKSSDLPAAPLAANPSP